MKFQLNVYAPAAAQAGPGERCHAGVVTEEGFALVVRQSGELVEGEMFADPAISAVVRVRDGVPHVGDGPYPGAGACPTGYYVVDCDSMERALELAAQHPAARFDAVEVRPLMTSTGLEM